MLTVGWSTVGACIALRLGTTWLFKNGPEAAMNELMMMHVFNKIDRIYLWRGAQLRSFNFYGSLVAGVGGAPVFNCVFFFPVLAGKDSLVACRFLPDVSCQCT